MQHGLGMVFWLALLAAAIGVKQRNAGYLFRQRLVVALGLGLVLVAHQVLNPADGSASQLLFLAVEGALMVGLVYVLWRERREPEANRG
jgi:hypothetical protein